MGFRDNLLQFGVNALGALGETIVDLAKASNKQVGTLEESSASNQVPTEKATEDPKSLFYDPFSIVEQLGYKDKPSPITYGTLKGITFKMPIVQAIIQTRVNQVASFCTPQKDRYQLGFRIRTRDHKKEPTKAERTYIENAETLMMRTGVTDNARGRDGLEKFVRKLVWDSLTYDQMTFEVVPNRKGLPAEWYAVDSATMRLADTASTINNEDDTKAVRYVQIYDGMIIAEYTQEEMCFGVRNPRTDIRLQGYGTSELEMLIPTITALLFAHEYNAKFFTQGSAAKGIINFKGTVPERELQNFRKQWYTQIQSVQNSWRTPITNSEDLQYISMQASARDMEFNAWMDFLIKVTCSVYAIDPVEVNFKYGNTGQKGGLQEANNKEKITESKERGLRPLLRFLADCFNKHIIWPINEDFEFDFVGLDAFTRDQMVDLNTKRVKSMMTVDELRAEDDLEPLPDGKGEIILDPTFLQYAQMKEGGGDEGGFGEPGGDMGEGEAEGEDVGDDDYEKMLSQYENEDDEDEDDLTDSERKAKAANAPPKVGDDLAKKSLTKSWVVNL